MIGEILAYLAGRSAGRREQERRRHHRRGRNTTPDQIAEWRFAAVVLVVCAVVVALHALL